MGDRALVVFHSADGSRVSPTIYLHWLGEKVPDLIQELATVMKGREDDVEYASARFCAIACAHQPGQLSIGLMETPADIMTNAKEHSHGDAGVILVDADTFEWKAYGGYLEDTQAA